MSCPQEVALSYKKQIPGSVEGTQSESTVLHGTSAVLRRSRVGLCAFDHNVINILEQYFIILSLSTNSYLFFLKKRMQKEDGARFAVSLVHEGALRLELPHATTASAMAVLSRYMNGCAGNASGAASHPLLVAMACVLVSAKAHDLNPMPSVRSIVIVFCHVARARMLAKARGGVVAPQSSSSTPPTRPMSLLSSQHQVWCNEIRNMEMSILKAVGFNLYAILQEHAHSYLLSILRSLKIDTMEKENQKLVAGAWTFLNDAWYFNETSPGVVAAAALLSSSQSCGRALPVGWSKGVSDASIQEVISSIKSLRAVESSHTFLDSSCQG